MAHAERGPERREQAPVAQPEAVVRPPPPPRIEAPRVEPQVAQAERAERDARGAAPTIGAELGIGAPLSRGVIERELAGARRLFDSIPRDSVGIREIDERHGGLLGKMSNTFNYVRDLVREGDLERARDVLEITRQTLWALRSVVESQETIGSRLPQDIPRAIDEAPFHALAGRFNQAVFVSETGEAIARRADVLSHPSGAAALDGFRSLLNRANDTTIPFDLNASRTELAAVVRQTDSAAAQLHVSTVQTMQAQLFMIQMAMAGAPSQLRQELDRLAEDLEEMLEGLTGRSEREVREQEVSEAAQRLRRFETDIIGDALDSIGAPRELVSAMRRIGEIGNATRRLQLLALGMLYLQNRAALEDPSNARLRDSIVQRAQRLVSMSDRQFTREVQREVNTFIHGLRGDFARVRETMRAAIAERAQSVSGAIEFLNQAISREENRHLRGAMERLRDGLERIQNILRNPATALSVTEQETMRGAMDYVRSMLGALSRMGERTEEERLDRATAGNLIANALDSYLSQGRSNRTKTLAFIAQEFMRTSERDYRSFLSNLAGEMVAGRVGVDDAVRRLADRLLGQGEQTARSLRESSPQAGDLLSRFLGGFRERIGQATPESLADARFAIESASGAARELQREPDERRSGALSILERALGALGARREEAADSHPLFRDPQEKIGQTTELIGLARRLSAEGAPEQIQGLAEGALRLIASGDTERARMAMRAVNLFLERRASFEGPAGQGAMRRLLSIAQNILSGGETQEIRTQLIELEDSMRARRRAPEAVEGAAERARPVTSGLAEYAGRISREEEFNIEEARAEVRRIVPLEMRERFREEMQRIDSIAVRLSALLRRAQSPDAAERERARASADQAREALHESIEGLSRIISVCSQLEAIGAGEELIAGVRGAMRDFGEGMFQEGRPEQGGMFRGRGDLILRMAEFYVEHHDAIRQVGGLENALGQLITTLGRHASAGTSAEDAAYETEAAEGMFGQAQSLVTDSEGSSAASTEANLQGFSDRLLLLREAATDSTLREALDRSREAIEDMRRRIAQGETPTEADAELFDRILSFVNYSEENILRGREGEEVAHIERILGRGLLDMISGRAEQGQAQLFIASQADGASREERRSLEEISGNLAGGTTSLEEALVSLRDHYAERVREVAGRMHERETRELFERVAGQLAEMPSLQSLSRLADALNAATRITEQERRIEGLRGAREREARQTFVIFRRALSSIAIGAHPEMSEAQLLMGTAYVGADEQTRQRIMRMSDRSEQSERVAAMEALTSAPEGQRVSAEEAARRVLGSGASGEAVAAMVERFEETQERGTLGDRARGEARAFVTLLARRDAASRLGRGAGSEEQGIYESVLRSIDSLMDDLSSGMEISEERLRNVQLQATMLTGSTDEIAASFVTSEDPEQARGQLEAASMLENLHSVLGRLRGDAREQASQIYRRGIDALARGETDDAVAYFSFAQAYAITDSEAEREMIMRESGRFERRGAAAGELPQEQAPVTAEEGRAMARFVLERERNLTSIETDSERSQYLSYSNFAYQALVNRDVNGASFMIEFSGLLGRAFRSDRADPEVQRVLALVQGNPELGLPSAEQLSEALGREPRPTVAQALFGDASAEEASRRMDELRIGLLNHRFGLDQAEFNSRVTQVDTPRARRRYDLERRRLERRVTGAEGAEAELATRHLELVDLGRTRSQIEQSQRYHSEGTSLLRQAAQLRLQAMRSADESERGRLNEQAGHLAERGALLIQSAEGLQQSALGIHGSVTRLLTRRRERGRLELARAGASFAQAAEIGVSAPPGALSRESLGEAASLLRSGGQDMQTGRIQFSRQLAIHRQVQALLREARRLEEQNERNEREYCGIGNSVRMPGTAIQIDQGPLAPEGTLPAVMQMPSEELAYYAERVRDRIERGRRAARSERFTSARRYLGAARDSMPLLERRAEAARTHWRFMNGDPEAGIQPASREEQMQARLSEFNMEQIDAHIQEGLRAADEGRSEDARRIGGEVRDQIRLGAHHQRSANRRTAIRGIRTALERNPPGSSIGRLTREQREAMDPEAVSAHDANVRILRENGVLGNLEGDVRSVVATLREQEELCTRAIEETRSVSDIPSERTAGDLFNGLQIVLEGEDYRDRAGRIYDEFGELRNEAEELDYFMRNPELLRDVLDVLDRQRREGTGGVPSGVSLSLRSDAGYREAMETYQDHAIGWNAATTFASRALEGMNRTDHLVRSGHVSSREQREALRYQAARLLQLARYASEHPGQVGDDIERGRMVYLPEVRMERGETGWYDEFHTRVGVQRVRLFDYYRETSRAELEILQDIGNEVLGRPMGPEAEEPPEPTGLTSDRARRAIGREEGPIMGYRRGRPPAGPRVEDPQRLRAAAEVLDRINPTQDGSLSDNGFRLNDRGEITHVAAPGRVFTEEEATAIVRGRGRREDSAVRDVVGWVSGRVLLAQMGPDAFRRVTAYYREAYQVSEADARMTFRALGFDVRVGRDGRSTGATALELTSEEQDALHDALGVVSAGRSEFMSIITGLRSFISIDDRYAALRAVGTEVDGVAGRVDRMLEGRRPAEGESAEAAVQRRRDTARRASSDINTSHGSMLSAVERNMEVGRSDEFWLAVVRAPVEMAAAGLVSAVPGGAVVVATYYLATSVESFVEQLDVTGGWEQMSGVQRVIGVGGIALAGLGFVTAGTSSLTGELGVLGRGSLRSVLGREAVAGLEVTPIGVAGELSPWAMRMQSFTHRAGQVMMAGGGAMGALQIYDMAEQSFRRGTSFSWGQAMLTAFTTAQPFMQMGMQRIQMRRPTLAYGSSFGARLYRGSMLLLFGTTQQQMQEQHSYQMHETYSRMITDVPRGTPRAARAQIVGQRRRAIAEIERTLGRQLEPQEGIALLSHFGQAGEGGRPAPIDPALSARLLSGYDSYLNSQISGLSQEYMAGIGRLQSDLGRIIEPGEILAISRQYPDRVPDIREAVRFLESSPDQVFTLTRYASEVYAPEQMRRAVTRAEAMRERAARVDFTSGFLRESAVESADGESFVIVRGETAAVYSREQSTEAANLVYHAERVLRGEQTLEQVPEALRENVIILMHDSEFRTATMEGAGRPRTSAQRRTQLERGLGAIESRPVEENVHERIERIAREASALRGAGRQEAASAMEREYTDLRAAAGMRRPRMELERVRTGVAQGLEQGPRAGLGATASRRRAGRLAQAYATEDVSRLSQEERAFIESVRARSLSPEDAGREIAQWAIADVRREVETLFVNGMEAAIQEAGLGPAESSAAHVRAQAMEEAFRSGNIAESAELLGLAPDDVTFLENLRRSDAGPSDAGREIGRRAAEQAIAARPAEAPPAEAPRVEAPTPEGVTRPGVRRERAAAVAEEEAPTVPEFSPERISEHRRAVGDLASDEQAVDRLSVESRSPQLSEAMQVAEGLIRLRGDMSTDEARARREEWRASGDPRADLVDQLTDTMSPLRAMFENADPIERAIIMDHLLRLGPGEDRMRALGDAYAEIMAGRPAPDSPEAVIRLAEQTAAFPEALRGYIIYGIGRARGVLADTVRDIISVQDPRMRQRLAQEWMNGAAEMERAARVEEARAARTPEQLAEQEAARLESLAAEHSRPDAPIDPAMLREIYGEGGPEGRLAVLEALGIDVGVMAERQSRIRENEAELRELEAQAAGFPQRSAGEVRDLVTSLQERQQALPEGSRERIETTQELARLHDELRIRARIEHLTGHIPQEARRSEANIENLFELVSRGSLRGRIREIPGFEGAEIRGVATLDGLRGAFRVELSDGRRVFVKFEDLGPARFGADLASAEGLISPHIHSGYSYDTGIRDPANGQPVMQEFGILEDVHDYATGPATTVTLPDGTSIPAHEGSRVMARLPTGETEEVTVLGAAMLRDEVLTNPDPANPAARMFWNLMQTPEGRQQVMQAWRAYHEMSRRALLMDRFSRNIVAVLVRRADGEIMLTFQPIDLDGIGNRIGGRPGAPEFAEFDADFAQATADFIRHTANASGAAGRIGTPEGRHVYEGGPLAPAALYVSFDSPRAWSGAGLPADGAETRARSREIVEGHDGQAFGFGFDTSSRGPRGAVQRIDIGRDRVMERSDGRATMHADETLDLMERAHTSQGDFAAGQSEAVRGLLELTPEMLAPYQPTVPPAEQAPPVVAPPRAGIARPRLGVPGAEAPVEVTARPQRQPTPTPEGVTARPGRRPSLAPEEAPIPTTRERAPEAREAEEAATARPGRPRAEARPPEEMPTRAGARAVPPEAVPTPQRVTRRGPPELAGIVPEAEGFSHADLPGRRFSGPQVERSGRIRRLAESLQRGEEIPAGTDATEIALASRIRARVRGGEDRANMRLALEEVGAEPAERTPEYLMRLSYDVAIIASERRGSGRFEEAARLEAEVVRLRREARGLREEAPTPVVPVEEMPTPAVATRARVTPPARAGRTRAEERPTPLLTSAVAEAEGAAGAREFRARPRTSAREGAVDLPIPFVEAFPDMSFHGPESNPYYNHALEEYIASRAERGTPIGNAPGEPNYYQGVVARILDIYVQMNTPEALIEPAYQQAVRELRGLRRRGRYTPEEVVSRAGAIQQSFVETGGHVTGSTVPVLRAFVTDEAGAHAVFSAATVRRLAEAAERTGVGREAVLDVARRPGRLMRIVERTRQYFERLRARLRGAPTMEDALSYLARDEFMGERAARALREAPPFFLFPREEFFGMASTLWEAGEIHGMHVPGTNLVLVNPLRRASHADRVEARTHETLHYAAEVARGPNSTFWVVGVNERGEMIETRRHTGLDEGITELLAQQVTREGLGLRPTAGGYRREVLVAQFLQDIAGADVLRRAYFDGDFSTVARAVDERFGEGTFRMLLMREEGRSMMDPTITIPEGQRTMTNPDYVRAQRFREGFMEWMQERIDSVASAGREGRPYTPDQQLFIQLVSGLPTEGIGAPAAAAEVLGARLAVGPQSEREGFEARRIGMLNLGQRVLELVEGGARETYVFGERHYSPEHAADSAAVASAADIVVRRRASGERVSEEQVRELVRGLEMDERLAERVMHLSRSEEFAAAVTAGDRAAQMRISLEIGEAAPAAREVVMEATTGAPLEASPERPRLEIVRPAAEAAAQLSSQLPRPSDSALAAVTELPVPGTDLRWGVIPPDQLPQWRERVWEAYRAAYERIGLIYPDADALFSRPRQILVVTDAQGQVIAFAFLKQTPYGLQRTLIGANPASAEGRAAARAMIESFGQMEGNYGGASGAVAALSVRAGVPVVPFERARAIVGTEAQRGDGPLGMDAIRAMPGFAESELVRHATAPDGVRPGARPEDLTWQDLVDQAVRMRELPDTPEVRESCYAIPMMINGRPEIVIKVMFGRPREVEAPAAAAREVIDASMQWRRMREQGRSLDEIEIEMANQGLEESLRHTLLDILRHEAGDPRIERLAGEYAGGQEARRRSEAAEEARGRARDDAVGRIFHDAAEGRPNPTFDRLVETIAARPGEEAAVAETRQRLLRAYQEGGVTGVRQELERLHFPVERAINILALDRQVSSMATAREPPASVEEMAAARGMPVEEFRRTLSEAYRREGVFGVFDAILGYPQGLSDEQRARIADQRRAFVVERPEFVEMIIAGNMEGNIRSLPGFGNVTITGAEHLSGNAGAFRVTLSDGRSIFVKNESMEPSALGARLLAAHGLVDISGGLHSVTYETGVVDANGRPLTRAYGLSEDVHGFAGRTVRMRLPEGASGEYRVRSVAMLGNEAMDPEAMERILSNPADPRHEAVRMFAELASTPEGRAQIFRAWSAYHEMSRRAMVIDRFVRNTAIFVVETPDGPMITFQPIDTDFVAGRIAPGEGGQPDYRGFYFDFARASANFTVDLQRFLERRGIAIDRTALAGEFLRGHTGSTISSPAEARERSSAVISGHEGRLFGLTERRRRAGSINEHDGGRRRAVQDDQGGVVMHADEIQPLADQLATQGSRREALQMMLDYFRREFGVAETEVPGMYAPPPPIVQPPPIEAPPPIVRQVAGDLGLPVIPVPEGVATGQPQAHGAAGDVYFTRMVIDGVEREVAVKVYRNIASAADPDFVRETRLARQLSDWGIGPRVYGIADVNGQPVVIMERVQGEHGDYARAPPERRRAIIDATSEETFRNLEEAVVRLYMNGLSPGLDFQYMIVTDGPDRGQVRIIDMGDLSEIHAMDEATARAEAQRWVARGRLEAERIRMAEYIQSDPQRREAFEQLGNLVHQFENDILGTSIYFTLGRPATDILDRVYNFQTYRPEFTPDVLIADLLYHVRLAEGEAGVQRVVELLRGLERGAGFRVLPDDTSGSAPAIDHLNLEPIQISALEGMGIRRSHPLSSDFMVRVGEEEVRVQAQRDERGELLRGDALTAALGERGVELRGEALLGEYSGDARAQEIIEVALRRRESTDTDIGQIVAELLPYLVANQLDRARLLLDLMGGPGPGGRGPMEGGPVEGGPAEGPISQLEYRRTLRDVDEPDAEAVRQHFGRELPTAAALDNVLIVLGYRFGSEARRKVEGRLIDGFVPDLDAERQGFVAIRGYYDSRTGRIIAFGDVEQIPWPRRGRATPFTLRYEPSSRQISVVTGGENPHLAALDGMIRPYYPIPEGVHVARTPGRPSAGGRAAVDAARELVSGRPAEVPANLREAVGIEAARMLGTDAPEHFRQLSELARDLVLYQLHTSGERPIQDPQMLADVTRSARLADMLPHEVSEIVLGLALNTRFRLNALQSDDTFNRYLGNVRTGREDVGSARQRIETVLSAGEEAPLQPAPAVPGSAAQARPALSLVEQAPEIDSRTFLFSLGVRDFAALESIIAEASPAGMRSRISIRDIGAMENGIFIEMEHPEGLGGRIRVAIPAEPGTTVSETAIREAASASIEGNRALSEMITSEGEMSGSYAIVLTNLLTTGRLSIHSLPEFLRPQIAELRDAIMEARRREPTTGEMSSAAAGAAARFRRVVAERMMTEDAGMAYYDSLSGRVRTAFEREATRGPHAEQREGREGEVPREERVFMLDTCYVIRTLEAEVPLYERLERLHQRGEIVMTDVVYQEVLRNLQMFSGRARAEAIAELQRARADGILSIEDVEVTQEDLDRLSGIMAGNSVRGNSRVGRGEASIVNFIERVGRELFRDIVILSEDSDVPTILRGSDIRVSSDYEQGR